ncbi:MAG TPA: HAD domain-containing protein [Chitinophaga sp.]|uniref:HAD domain-containing protein n=1 Tax=Chitinophaga sp. TaxID=1869181 RepID=UPI002BC6BB33|nr:HAD domain-containing protein [Chitinophaga sp.]HVI47466.1 HAD domain-containing protein [Chitinophaga sp.]
MLVFLDIDGVMVPANSWKRPEILRDGFFAFSNKAVSALQKLISYDTTIMLTTSHKERYNLTEWKNIFSARGINASIQSLPANINQLNRKDEIEKWFASNYCGDSFLIIDDDKSLNDLPANLKSNLIQTYSAVGLTEEHVLPALEILESA